VPRHIDLTHIRTENQRVSTPSFAGSPAMIVLQRIAPCRAPTVNRHSLLGFSGGAAVRDVTHGDPVGRRIVEREMTTPWWPMCSPTSFIGLRLRL
jgi:hypothetical protein